MHLWAAGPPAEDNIESMIGRSGAYWRQSKLLSNKISIAKFGTGNLKVETASKRETYQKLPVMA